MASTDDEAVKLDQQEDARMDSGIDLLRSINKDDQPLRSNPEQDADMKDKLYSVPEDRLDSAYSSSMSVSVESLTGMMRSYSISEEPGGEVLETTEGGEEETSPLAIITDDGDTILHLAIIHEKLDFAEKLVDLFPKEILDIQNNLYQTPLHLATYLNLPPVVRRLIQKEASLEVQDQDGNTPVHLACEHGRKDCAQAMAAEMPGHQLKRVLKMQNWRGLTCLHLVTLRRNCRLMKFLISMGADLNVQEGTSGKTPLHLAVELHDMTLVSLLLSKGANVDAAMFNGCTPLHLAVGRQDASIATLLCQSGADRMLKNMEDETALDLADGNDDILALFPFDDIQISGRSVIGMKF
ncbi:NF-kappa-B inhibitor epsilon [Brienomyrus brachyistius]|uniref:NF-kappa-B inhibitor epsilon n=1 Tax=Brienomyrus brachyistius TaxID=42636 RepID=UPI0020B1A019|nr:NF-kappa-B inhibitor epsilon [Brienomyrus brachyistius]XP_048841911.1 NF-kappa-B inhibitor epsilon [Brienomyrus brachyistius]